MSILFDRRMRLRDRLKMLWHVRIHPSPLQREFNRGDPHGTVARCAALIIAELELDTGIAREEKPKEDQG